MYATSWQYSPEPPPPPPMAVLLCIPAPPPPPPIIVTMTTVTPVGTLKVNAPGVVNSVPDRLDSGIYAIHCTKT
jgi:hypothetical protein